MAAAPDILVINLDRSPDRLAFMARQLDGLGLAFTRLPATEAASIPEADFERLANKYMRPMSRSELGCLISHARAWQVSVDQDKPILILEDDAFLSDKLPAFLSDYTDLKIASVVNLETRGEEKWVSNEPVASATVSGVQLYKLYIDRGGAAGYIVSPASARALLRLARDYAAPADAFLNLSGVEKLQAEPGLVSPLFEGGNRESRLRAGFRTTIQLPSKASRMTLIVRRPHFTLRRLAGYFAMSVRKLRTIGVGMKREVAICPTILARADNWSA